MSISINQSRVVASQQALLNLRVWESCLSFRISLQKILEIANKLPVLENSLTDLESSCVESKSIQSVLGNLYEMLQPSPNLKRKRSDISWEDISDQYEVNSVKWKDVLNKWNSRLNFGSKDTQSKMKTFRQTLWEQIETSMNDDKRTIEKSRVSLSESQRIGKESDGALVMPGTQFDEEVYDDRQFYSLLLKTFIGQQQSSSLLSTSKEDSDALKKFRKSKNNVERKASKGRKIRYKTHNKLQNFMFPIELAESDMDTKKLFQSLFQS